jgi:hypothetical protein
MPYNHDHQLAPPELKSNLTLTEPPPLSGGSMSGAALTDSGAVPSSLSRAELALILKSKTSPFASIVNPITFADFPCQPAETT